MSNFSLVFRIALAKLRTRKLRVVLTVCASCLAFTLVFVAIAASVSVFDSLTRASDRLYAGASYIEVVDSNYTKQLKADDPSFVSLVRQQYNSDKEKYKNLIKAAGLEYDEFLFENPIVKQDDIESVDQSSQYAQRIQIEHTKASQPRIPTMDGVLEVGRAVVAKPMNGELIIMKDGRVDQARKDALVSKVDAITLIPDEALAPYVAESTVAPDADQIPLLLNMQMYRDIFGKRSIASTLGTHIDMCYRNSVAKNIFETLRFSNIDMTDVSRVSYKRSGDGQCVPPEVVKNSRTAERRKNDVKKAVIDKQFGVETEPLVEKVTFVLTGVLPSNSIADSNTQGLALGVEAAIGMAAIGRSVIPVTQSEKLLSTGIFSLSPYGYGLNYEPLSTAHIMKAKDARTASDYVRKYHCDPMICSSTQALGVRELTTGYYPIAVAKDNLAKITQGIAVTVFCFSVIIMAATFSRIVDDGRREVAIYRAIGIPGRAIWGVFILYGAVVALMTGILSLFVSYIWLWILDRQESNNLTQVLYARFGEPARDLSVTLLGAPHWLGILLVAMIFACGVISIIIALTIQRRHSVVDDLRLTE